MFFTIFQYLFFTILIKKMGYIKILLFNEIININKIFILNRILFYFLKKLNRNHIKMIYNNAIHIWIYYIILKNGKRIKKDFLLIINLINYNSYIYIYI